MVIEYTDLEFDLIKHTIDVLVEAEVPPTNENILETLTTSMVPWTYDMVENEESYHFRGLLATVVIKLTAILDGDNNGG